MGHQNEKGPREDRRGTAWKKEGRERGSEGGEFKICIIWTKEIGMMIKQTASLQLTVFLSHSAMNPQKNNLKNSKTSYHTSTIWFDEGHPPPWGCCFVLYGRCVCININRYQNILLHALKMECILPLLFNSSPLSLTSQGES